MARCILIFGQPSSGKSFSLRNLDPSSSVIIDADKKGMLPWRGSIKSYNRDNQNFFSTSSLDGILKTVRAIGSKDEWKHITTLVIDGFNNAMISEIMYYEELHNTKNNYEKWNEVAAKTYKIIDTAQSLRNDLSIIFTAHVETADPYVSGDVDKVFTPGRQLKEKIKVESKFSYVFYAKVDNGDYFFETIANNSTARSPHECYPDKIPNDIAAAIKIAQNYESAEAVTDD